jgi:hypothetical protein
VETGQVWLQNYKNSPKKSKLARWKNKQNKTKRIALPREKNKKTMALI